MTISNYKIGPLSVEGCFVNDFLLTDHLPAEKAPEVIERDRLIMSARPGFERKLLPLSIQQETGNVYSGGRYLFDSYENAVGFANWCKNDFELDGVLMLERPDFADIRPQVYRVIGAHDFRDIHTAQTAIRTEIWHTETRINEDKLVNMWPSLRDRADAEGKSSIWLLHNAEVNEVALISLIDRVGQYSDCDLDYASLNSVASAHSYGDDWNWAEKIFDRSHWVYCIWFPGSNNVSARASLWPNSPPLPAPEQWKQATSAA